MQRTLKFRAWDSTRRVLADVVELTIYDKPTNEPTVIVKGTEHGLELWKDFTPNQVDNIEKEGSDGSK